MNYVNEKNWISSGTSLWFKRPSTKKIKAELDEVHGTSAPVHAAVYNWVDETKHGRASPETKSRLQKPVIVATPEIIYKIFSMVLSDQQIKLAEAIVRYSFSSFARKIWVLRRYLDDDVSVTGTWIYQVQWKQYGFDVQRASKKAKTVKSAGKLMATIFGDPRMIIHND